ncbi:GntR family carbon starvation induced transcriptional regulator [Bradyrhizobium diazoefficiens]|uniref:GntR family transcriptional regulator n=1 Tax=Bradyrhizobium diazoefficiens TaxID=1355477 RepID=UPI003513DE6B
MPTADISARTMASHAADLLRELILSGTQQPGARLGIDELKRQFGIGASPLREALNLLVAEGFVQRIDQRGFRVASADRTELADLIETRCLIEGAAVRASIERGDESWEEGVILAHHRLAREARSLLEEKFEPNPTWDELHSDFHLSLLAACGAPRLLQICRGLHQQATRFRNLSNTVGWGQRDVRQEHAALMKAAIERRADEAVRLLQEHYRKTGAVLAGDASD